MDQGLVSVTQRESFHLTQQWEEEGEGGGLFGGKNSSVADKMGHGVTRVEMKAH